MKTYEQLKESLTSTQAILCLKALKNKKATSAQKALLAYIIENDYTVNYDINFIPQHQRIVIASKWDESTRNYNRTTSFNIPEIFS